MLAFNRSKKIKAPLSNPEASRPVAFGKSFQISIILHGTLISVFVLKSLVFPSSQTPFIPTLRVDLVGLPDELKKDLPQPGSSEPKTQKKEPPKKEPPRKPEPSPEKSLPSPNAAKRAKNAIDRLRALSKVENDATGAPVKGNRVSKGASMSGAEGESDSSVYLDTLRNRLRSNWELPLWVARQRLSAQVLLFMEGDGKLREIRFVKKSGSDQFDQAVVRAIQDSEPFAPPPTELLGAAMVHGISLGFPL